MDTEDHERSDYKVETFVELLEETLERKWSLDSIDVDVDYIDECAFCEESIRYKNSNGLFGDSCKVCYSNHYCPEICGNIDSLFNTFNLSCNDGYTEHDVLKMRSAIKEQIQKYE